MSPAAASARSAWSGSRSGAPNTASRPSPRNLFAWPPCSVTHGTTIPKRSFRKLTVSRALERCANCGEVADVEDHHGDLALLALDQLAALLEHALGHVGVDVGAERLAQRLALGEALHHLVEAPRELAHLVARR